MKFENTKVWGFEHTLRGMRNPMNSWDKSDSLFSASCHECEHSHLCNECIENDSEKFAVENPIIGENDLKLAKKLIKAGTEHRKFMRQIFVSVDITAPLYWWKEFDTYKIGTVANSTSTMHKLASTPITIDCFETDDLLLSEDKFTVEIKEGITTYYSFGIGNYLFWLEGLRQKYNETKDKRFWRELIRWLPESWLQTRTVTMNYENIMSMINQRLNHKMNEWSGNDNPCLGSFIGWTKSLPYARELFY